MGSLDTYYYYFQRTGIDITEFEKTQIRFTSDVFAALDVVDAKAPYWTVHGIAHSNGSLFTASKKHGIFCVFIEKA